MAAGSATGRADLVRAFAARGEEGLAGMARLLDYREEPVAPSGERLAPSEAAWPRGGEALPPGEPAEVAPVPFWRLEAAETLAPPEDGGETVELLTLSELEPRGERPDAAPLVAWPRLWPALHPALRSAVPSREIDAVRLVERWSRGDPVARLPRRAAFAWSRRVTVVVDRSPRLIPFWHDQDELCRRLGQLLGHAGLRIVLGGEGPDGAWLAERGRPAPGPASAAAGETVLVLGDLGFYAGAAVRASWARTAQTLRRNGVLPRALVPCPTARWSGGLGRLWHGIDWSSPLGGAARAAPRLDDEALRARSERLLALVAPALRVEPGFLRAVRRLLPASEADAGTEADVWSHPDVDGGSVAALRFEASADRWRDAFRREDAELRAAAIRELRRWHAALPAEIWREEALTLDTTGGGADGALPAEEAEEARLFALRLGRTVVGSEDSPLQKALRPYFVRFGGRLPEALWSDPRLGPPLALAWAEAQRSDPDLPLPPGVVPAPDDGVPRRWTVWQSGSTLRFLPAGEEPPEDEPGSPLATLWAGRRITVAAGPGGWGVQYDLGAAPPSCPLPSASFVLATARERAELLRFVPPQWASAAGRDRYGLWTAVEVDGVDMRFRWTPPGRFLMGSPEEETGRDDDEGPRHEVTLTRGYWLTETPCTQALWQAVTGENPSRFQSPDRPVEQVSWNDCQELLKALNQRLPGLEARLPTEAEWEYACRAGSETSTYAGELEILGKNNAPLLDKIAWYGGNSGVGFELDEGVDSSDWKEKQYPHSRAGTRPVAQKEANSWGLYDMLGNVYEWCSDWQGSYDGEAVENPQGLRGSLRVIRGGSWHDIARRARAACRYWSEPGARHDLLGFRLARGQGQ